MKRILCTALVVALLAGLAWAADKTATQSTVGNASYDVTYWDIADVALDDPNYMDTVQAISGVWHYKNIMVSVARNTDGDCDSAALTIYFYGRLEPNTGWFLMDSTIAMPGKVVVAGKGDTLGYLHQIDLDAKAFIGIKDMRIIRATTNADNCSCNVKDMRVSFTKH